MILRLCRAFAASLLLVTSGMSALAQAAPHFTVTFPASRSAAPLDGRLLLLLSTDPSAEPRMQIDDTPKSQLIFGVTVDGWRPGTPMTVDASATGYPIHSLADVPPGDYTVQALLNRYETFHRADGKTIKLAPDRGEGQHWNLAPGNLYSKPAKIHLGGGATLSPIALTEEIPPIATATDTKYIRHIRIQSQVLRPAFRSSSSTTTSCLTSTTSAPSRRTRT